MREEHLEVKRKHGPSPAQRILIHLDFILAFLCVVLLVLQLVGIVLQPAPATTEARRAITEAVSRLETLEKESVYPVDKEAAAVSEQIGSLVSMFRHEMTPARDVPAGLSYPLGYLATLRPGESNEIRFLSPINAKVAIEAGALVVTWGERAGNNVKIGSFEILRSEDGGKDSAVAKVDGNVTTWKDTTVRAGHEYVYRIRAIAGDKDLAETERGKTAPSDPASGRAIADWKIELLDMRDDEAVLKVSKWKDGSWRDRTFTVRAGGTVGGQDDAMGVDFSTGRKVASMKVDTVDTERVRDELVFDAKARVVLDDGVPRRVSVTSVEPVHKIKVTLSGADLPDETLEMEKR